LQIRRLRDVAGWAIEWVLPICDLGFFLLKATVGRPNISADDA